MATNPNKKGLCYFPYFSVLLMMLAWMKDTEQYEKINKKLNIPEPHIHSYPSLT